jgi:hypothetical protein
MIPPPAITEEEKQARIQRVWSSVDLFVDWRAGSLAADGSVDWFVS